MDVYIDESGDIGFGERSSPFFVIIALIVQEPLQIKRCFSKIRRNRLNKHHREVPELKFNNSNDTIKKRVLKCLAQSNIEFWSSILRKEQLFEPLRRQPQIVYNYLAGSLIGKINAYYKPPEGITIIVDKSLNGINQDLFNQYITYKMMEQIGPINEPFTPPKILHLNSEKEPCIQAADFIAGAIHRKYRQGDDAYFKIIERRCKQIFDYFQGSQKRL